MKYISTFELFEGYNKPRAGGKRRWSVKYKKKINCNNPKGFSQIQYCKRKRRGGHYKTESLNESDYYRERELMRVLQDMSLELWDENFNVQVSSEVLSEDEKYINVSFQKLKDYRWSNVGDEKRPMEEFSFNDIKDVFLSMIHFMESEGYSYTIKSAITYINSNSISGRDVKVREMELKDEDLYLLGRPSLLNKSWSILQLLLKFKE